MITNNTNVDDTEYMLTTVDNPYNPFTNWDQWFAYDLQCGYDTPSFLARIVQTSYEISDSAQQVDINNAIDEIVEINANGLYRKVSQASAFELGLV